MTSRTWIRQDAQISSTLDTLVGFVDNTAPAATMESAAGHLADDLNNMRSIINLHKKADQSLNWHDDLTAPSTLEAGSKRGIDDLNDALHLVEKKRVLRCLWKVDSLSIAGAGDTFDILGTGELPGNTTAAVGAVSTLGTVVAFHSGTFGTASLDEVAGLSAIAPKNLVSIVDAVTRDPVLDGDDRIYGLLQSETVTDGHTITDTTTTRVQISFVKINGTGDDLIAISSGAMDGVSYDYCYVERVRLEDLNEQDFLKGAAVDVPAGATVTRQAAYDGQGTTPVDVTTNSTLDLEGAGLTWTIRDDLEAMLFQLVEGSAGGTSQLNVGAAVDEFDIDAALVNFAAGISTRSGGTRPIDIGVTDGVIETTAGALKLLGFTDLIFEDDNKAGSTYASDFVLSDASSEWDTFETNFGEVSLLNAINQAYAGQLRTKVQAVLTANVTAGSDVNGPGTPHNNTDVDLAPFNLVSFVNDVEIFLNGQLLYNDATSGGSGDVYPGGTPADGDLAFNDNLKGTGSKPDVLTVIVNGQ